MSPTSSSQDCHLLAGTFATSVQVFLGLVAMSTLLYKRLIENESTRRPFEIWLMDVSKQGVASIFVHFINIGMSILFASLPIVSTTGESGDECAFYFLTFVLDTVVGVFLVWLQLNAIRRIAVAFKMTSIQDQGYYGYPPRYSWYTHQLLCFLFVITISKIVIAAFMFSFSVYVSDIGNAIFEPFQLQPNLELVVVMVVCPCFLNIVQYWVQDNILDASSVHHSEYEMIETSEDISLMTKESFTSL